MALVTTLTFGCEALLGIEDTKDDDPNVRDGSVSSDRASSDEEFELVPNDAGDIPDPSADANVVLPSAKDAADDGGDQPIPDAGAGSNTCLPISTFIPASGATGTVCNPNSVLAGGTGFVGLDYNSATQTIGSIDGYPVTSCVGTLFAKPLSQVTVRVGSISQGCDNPCVGTNCGTGDDAHVFVGNSGVFQHLASLKNLSTAYADFTIATTSLPLQVLVCRTGNGASRDDVKVNHIYGLCTN